MDIKRCIVRLIYLFQSLFFKKDTRCPFCLNSDFKIIFRKKGIVDICHCLKCDLYWTNPIFKFWRFYDFFYEAEGLTTSLVHGDLLNKLLSSSFKGTDKDCHQIIHWLKGISCGGKLLEFGSSWGYFLYQAESQGFKVTGVEISKKRREFGRKKLGVEIISDINEVLLEKQKFDLIFTAHTLEHLTFTVGDIFNKFYTLLNDKGYLIIEVPYLNLMESKEIFKIMGAVHPLGFCKNFFVKNLPKYGFEVEIHYGYKDLIPGYEDKGDNLVVVCKKGV